MEETTDSLRELATRWSLAGDEKLLKLLQNTHQKIVSKCREINTKMDEMSAALGDTAINLQNVNNKFMALSNNQFIESRVFDDDADITTSTKPIEETPEAETVNPLLLLKQSLKTLDNAHETAEIWDDSDMDSDTEISVILKPKDAYAHRPLPYIIGSPAWKNKWHAGLIIEDSDTDSDISKHDVGELDQYSESEEDVRTDKLVPDTTISESGSSFHSERGKDLASIPAKKQTPADIAAELAARLGNAPPRVLEEPEEGVPQSTPNTVYRPQKPVSSTIFFDEPPPIEKDTHDQYSSESQEEDDIFAEINKKQPYASNNTAQSDLTDDLFGRKISDENLSDFRSKVEPKSAKQKSTLFEEESEPELFVEKPKAAENNIQSVRNDNTKKPVGGISLFGSNKEAESIGAAILKRNKQKSSSSDSENDALSNKNTLKNDPVIDSEDDNTTNDNTNNANYIFDNLFAKAKQAEQKSAKQAKVDRPVMEETPKAAKTKEVKDLFSDNIFDDIDDIFTSNIKIPTKEANKNAKSIFDDDYDDLFSDVAKVPKETTKNKDTASSKKSIFDSDDDLFGDVKETKDTSKNNKSINKNKPENVTQITQNRKETYMNTAKPDLANTKISVNVTKNIESKKEPNVKPKAKSKSIFDSDSDEDLFSDKNKTTKTNKVSETSKGVDSDTESELFKDKKETQHVTFKTEPAKVINKPIKVVKSSDVDFVSKTELFTEKKETQYVTLDTETTKHIHSPSLFEEDEIDDLFINANKAKDASLASRNTIIEQMFAKDMSNFENEHKVIEDLKENALKVEEKPTLDENRPRVIEGKKSPSVDNAIPERVPDELQDDFFRHVETVNTLNIPSNDDIIEASQESLNVQNKSSSTSAAEGSNLKEPVRQIDNIQIKHADTENDSLLSESQEPFADQSKTKSSQYSKVADSIVKELPVEEKLDAIPEQKGLVPLAAAFDDIFKEPPAFEKTKDVKKTVNVNALFEDDSDDEALFFKKNDVTSDEKPEIFSPSANFGLFNDEPPAFVNFAPKSTKNNQFEGDDDYDLFSSISKKEDKTTGLIRSEPPHVDESVTQSENTTHEETESSLLSSTEIPKFYITTAKTKTKERKEVPDSDEELFSNAKVPETSQKENTPKPEPESSDQLDVVKPKDIKTETDTKIGKLNTKNYNINVQALVPGASPKKIPKEPSNDTTESNKINTIETEESETTKEEVSITEVDNAEPKAVKSISFESKPESGVLDNKLSKQRPRIQVKRRPSSRRARHEAVRKSVIDIDDDTDNSSSFDEPLPKIINQDTKFNENESYKRQNNDVVTKTSITDLISNENKKQDIAEMPSEHNITNIQNDLDDIDKMFKTDTQTKIDTLSINNEIPKDKITSLDEVDSEVILKREKKLSKEISAESTSTTKVVYILNDEDIFSNNTEKHKGTKTSNTVKANEEKRQELTKTVQPKKETKSMFDLSDDDDDLFGKSSKIKTVEVKSKLFESDSEEDIFSGKKKNKQATKHKEEAKEGKAKGSLFGDDDDGDLFGVKTKTSTKSTKITPSTRPKEAAKPTNIVFDDPLSMLDDD